MSATALCLGCDKAIEHGELCQLCRYAVLNLRELFTDRKWKLHELRDRLEQAEYYDEYDLWYIPVPAPVRTT